MFLVLLVVALLSHHAIPALSLDPAWAYDASQFYRRVLQSSIVVQDNLYIDGGEVYYLNEKNFPRSLPLNSTYSISLASAWNNASVSLQPIAKGSAPVLNGANLWPDSSGSSFYQYNGIISLAYATPPDPPANQLWQFLPDGASGEWTIVDAPNLKRLAQTGSTSGNGSAYILGGWQSWRTTIDYTDHGLRYPAGGLVTYDLTSRTWSNQSIEELAPSTWSYMAELHYLKGLKQDGLLLAMGGATAPTGILESNEQTLNSYGYVSVFDTATGQWHNQSTSGDIPVQRYQTCSVGVRGDNGTFEIFLYGGSVIPAGTAAKTDQQSNIDLAEVSILSLPSFNWHRTTLSPKQSRSKHSCNLAGQRQMIVVGGTVPNVGNNNLPKDPWNQGLGVFDLTNLEWKDSYDPSASPYQTPDIIKQYISASGPYPGTWDSPTVESLFSDTAVSNNSSSSTPAGDANDSGGSNTGAIVGGVIGGIGGLLILGLAWFFYRRHKRSQQPVGARLDSNEQSPQGAEQYRDGFPMGDMASQSEGKASTQPNELSAASAKYELPTTREQKTYSAHELP